MVRDDFDDSVEQPRDPPNKITGTEPMLNNLDELAAEHAALGGKRNNSTKQRKKAVSSSEPPTPDDVVPDRRSTNVAPIGKIAAGVSVVVIAIALFFGVKAIQALTAEYPIEYVDVDEFMDAESCQWTVRVTLRNDSDTTAEVMTMLTVLNRQRAAAVPTAYPTLEPGDTAVATGVFTLRNVTECPAPEDIDHGNLVIRLSDGTEISRNF